MGIIAGRLKDKYNLPSCVATKSDGMINGSGRSIAGVDLGKIIHDALAAGVPFSMENTRPPYGAFCVIGIFTLILCTFGAYLGNRFGENYPYASRP